MALTQVSDSLYEKSHKPQLILLFQPLEVLLNLETYDHKYFISMLCFVAWLDLFILISNYKIKLNIKNYLNKKRKYKT